MQVIVVDIDVVVDIGVVVDVGVVDIGVVVGGWCSSPGRQL